MPQMKKAVITFDPERISQINIQAEGEVLAYIIREGLLGRPYAKERGIFDIEVSEPHFVRVPYIGEAS